MIWCVRYMLGEPMDGILISARYRLMALFSFTFLISGGSILDVLPNAYYYSRSILHVTVGYYYVAFFSSYVYDRGRSFPITITICSAGLTVQALGMTARCVGVHPFCAHG